MKDTGEAFTCLYTSPTGTVGLNVTIQVLGPYNAADKVEIYYDLASVRSRALSLALYARGR